MKKYGVVFAGGGTRGAYEIGVWKALRELDIFIEAVAGTSIGAINGAMMVQGDYEIVHQLWLNIDINKVIKLGDADLLQERKLGIREFGIYLRKILRNGGLDISPLKEMLRDCLDEDKIRLSPIDFALVTYSLTDLKPVVLYKKDIPKGKMLDYIIASAALPVFKNHEIDNKKYIDGAAYDNRPVSLIADIGIKDIVVVDVSGLGRVRKVKNEDINIIFIKNSQYLGGMLEFDREVVRRNIDIGYLDALKAFGRLAGKKYYMAVDSDYSSNLVEPLKDDELDLFVSFLDIGNNTTPADEFIRYRILRALGKYTGRSIDRKNIITAAAEITAGVFGIDRVKVYTLHELVEKILLEYFKVRDTKIFSDSINILKGLVQGKGDIDFKGLDSSLIASYAACYSVKNTNIKGYKRLLAALSPRVCISSLFIMLLLRRKEKYNLHLISASD
ncbi:MAG: patatin-like phospholipase family protein [Acetivibrionales bacterium]|jgi:NTE family protein